MNVVVMDGAIIGESAMVAAMAFVRAGFEVPARSLAAGIPAKILCPLTNATSPGSGKERRIINGWCCAASAA